MAGAIDTKNYRRGTLEELAKLTGDDYERMFPDLVNTFKKLMPKPNSYNELIEKLKDTWSEGI